MSVPIDSGEARAALVVPALVPARSEPSHRAERVTEWVCGETLALAERRDEWARTVGLDGYEAWVPLGSLELVPDFEAESWRAAATLWSLGTELLAEGRGARAFGSDPEGRPGAAPEASRHDGPGARPTFSVPNRLPWGGRVAPAAGGAVRLPDGATARPRDTERLVSEPARARRFPRDGGELVETAARWLGAPYAWGGRTEGGVDCSGLVQAVYALHGAPLPRDSDAQAAADPPVAATGGASGDRGSAPTERGRVTDSGREGLDLQPDDLEPGDLIFFAPEGRGISHVAIAAGGPRILHAAASRGAVAWDDLWSDAPLARRLRESIVRVTRPLNRAAPSPIPR